MQKRNQRRLKRLARIFIINAFEGAASCTNANRQHYIQAD